MLLFSSLAVAALMVSANDGPAIKPPDAITLPPETDAQRAARHAAIAKARQGTILLAHRGAATIAPEDTLKAIDAALQLGCQAVKLDFRRTLDGVIVIYHDDRLEHRLDIFGAVETSYYDELLLGCIRRNNDDNEYYLAMIPTLDEVLKLLRRRNGLVYVDVKTPGLSDALLSAFRKADMLDHIIGYSVANSEAFQRAAIPQIAFKGSLLETHRDLEPDSVKQTLAKPGQVVFLDDPRLALTLLGQQAVRLPCCESCGVPRGAAYRPNDYSLAGSSEYEKVLFGQSTKFPLRAAAARMNRVNSGFLLESTSLLRSSDPVTRRVIARNVGFLAAPLGSASYGFFPAIELLPKLCDDPDSAVRAEAALACARAKLYQVVSRQQVARQLDLELRAKPKSTEERKTAIEARGEYAFALGLFARQLRRNRVGAPQRDVGNVLLNTFRQRETGKNCMWLGVDGAMAAWALGESRVADAVPLFREVLLWQPPPGEEAADDDEPPRAYVYWDLQAPRFLPTALVEIGTPEALAVLDEILNLPENRARRGSPELLVRTAAALAQSPPERRLAAVTRLIAHKATAVRGEAILQCLREAGREYRGLLEANAAWAVPWWDAEHGGKRQEKRP